MLRGPLGLLEVSENFNNDDGVTACEEDDLVHETNRCSDDVNSLRSVNLSVVSNNSYTNLRKSRTTSENSSLPDVHSAIVVTNAKIHRRDYVN